MVVIILLVHLNFLIFATRQQFMVKIYKIWKIIMKSILYTTPIKKIPRTFNNLLLEEQKNLQNTVELEKTDKKYTTHYSYLNVPFDKSIIKDVKKVIENKKKLDINTLVVIGIGGSHLGTAAIHQAINGLLYNEVTTKTKIFFADTTDPHYLAQLIKILEKKQQQGKNILLNIVTQSGTTVETIANFEILVELLKKDHLHYQDYIVVTTNANSPLDHWAQKEKIRCLYIPPLVGGRYSVLSAVGLFPLGFIGINIDQLLLGARHAITASLKKQNFVQKSAYTIYEAYQKGQHIHDLFIFALELEAFGKWYRQLTGESLGKGTIDNPQKRRFLTPTVSLGTSDLHSVAQLYLGGLPPTFTTFIGIKHWQSIIKIKTDPTLKPLSSDLQGKTINDIIAAIFSGTIGAYKKQHKNFAICMIPEINEYFIGNLIQSCMLQTTYLGKLLNVHPFDQPHVELYKKEVRKILKKKKD